MPEDLGPTGGVLVQMIQWLDFGRIALKSCSKKTKESWRIDSLTYRDGGSNGLLDGIEVGESSGTGGWPIPQTVVSLSSNGWMVGAVLLLHTSWLHDHGLLLFYYCTIVGYKIMVCSWQTLDTCLVAS